MIYESLTTSIDGLESSIEVFMRNHARVTEQRDALVAALQSIDNLAENYPYSTADEFAKIARAALSLV